MWVAERLRGGGGRVESIEERLGDFLCVVVSVLVVLTTSRPSSTMVDGWRSILGRVPMIWEAPLR